MDFVVASIHRVEDQSRSSPTDIAVSTENEFEPDPVRRTWRDVVTIPRCGLNSKYFCTCGFGVALLVSGTCCLVLYFVYSRVLLIPALALFIIGIVVSSVGEWYCRIKIRQRQIEMRRDRDRISDEDCERVAQAVQRQMAAQAAANDQPPAYSTLSTLPTVSSRSNDAYTGDEGDDISPPYTAYDVANEVLPSYKEATTKRNDRK
uniref:Uncharacterized protein n=1 Tax=Ciona savignyi TaxID=51511 RepID=H2Z6B6_CIOSA